jgi:dipeptidyl aminopeptidase/acylaminoacyl peptidase
LEGNVGKHGDVSSAVKCVVDEFGPTDFLTMNAGKSSMDHDAADSPESRLIGGAIQENKDKANAASPLTHVNKVDVPFLIIHGDADPLVPHDQSVRFAAALKGAGVETALITVHGAGHGNFRNPEIAATIRRFFDKHLRGRGEEKMVDGVVENMGK